MLLYHGTTIESALNILLKGFQFDHAGKNWGSTYGKAIYFTPNYETAKCYAGPDGIILSFSLDISDFYLLKNFISPSKRHKVKTNKKWLITPDLDEYIMLR